MTGRDLVEWRMIIKFSPSERVYRFACFVYIASVNDLLCVQRAR